MLDVQCAGEHLGEPGDPVDTEMAGLHRTPQVGIHQDCWLARFGEHRCQMGRDGRLAFALHRGGHDYAAGRVVDADEAKVCAQLAQGLGGRPHIGSQADRAHKFVRAGSDPQRGGTSDRFGVGGLADAAIQRLASHHDPEAGHQPKRQPD